MRRRYNAIDKIVVEGERYDDVSSVMDAIVHFYKKLYQEDIPCSYNYIDKEDASELVKEFSDEEIWKAINDLGKDKAPGPDGFNIAFFQHC